MFTIKVFSISPADSKKTAPIFRRWLSSTQIPHPPSGPHQLQLQLRRPFFPIVNSGGVSYSFILSVLQVFGNDKITPLLFYCYIYHPKLNKENNSHTVPAIRKPSLLNRKSQRQLRSSSKVLC